MLFITIFLAYLLQPGGTIIAYDCGAPSMNITTMSLLDIQECDIPIHEPKVTESKIQLLQRVEFSTIKVIQCKLEIHRVIKHCGMHSHTSEVKNGRTEYIQPLSRNVCFSMHNSNTFQAYSTVFQDLTVNATNIRNTVLAGSVDNNGNCHGASFSDSYGSWDNVFVIAELKFTLAEHHANVKLNQDEIILQSGKRCKFSDGRCMDFQVGHTFWEPVQTDQCKFNNYEVVYEGLAERIQDTKEKDGEEIYSITSADITFALAVKGHTVLCGYKLAKTEHPKLFIADRQNGDFFAKKRVSTVNMDIFAYMNSKLVYLVRHFGNQIISLYNNVVKQECELEKRVLRNTLSFAAFAPAEFAYYYMKEPGYISHIAGEVLRIAKCVPVNVATRKTDECYQEMPITRGNESLFMVPRTRIITKTGHEIECNSFLSPMYHINNIWYQSLPQLARAAAPEEISANTKATWKFTTPEHLADSGIYSTKDLENLRSSIMFPLERTAVLNTLARGASGQKTVDQGISINHWINDDIIEEKIEKVWGKVYSFFHTVGTFSATFLGVWVTARAVKFIIDTLVHGYALHSIYGWSVWLIGSIWDSITNLLLHIGNRKNNPRENDGSDVPLQTVNTAAPQGMNNTEPTHKLYPSCPVTEELPTSSTEAQIWHPMPHPIIEKNRANTNV